MATDRLRHQPGPIGLLFNSPEYLVFLIVCLLLYGRLGHRGQNAWLLAASYAFYSFWDPRFLVLILLSTSVDFWAGQRIESARREGQVGTARRALHVSLATNLGLLGVFKYFGFFVESAAAALDTLGLGMSRPALEIVLPVGISFYTFQTLSYTIDVYRGRLGAIRDPLDFALFVAFFPQLVAGPIERARNLLPQIQAPRRVTPRQFEEGLWLILMGLYRKLVIADTAAIFVDRIFAHPFRQSSLQMVCGLMLYGLQIYGDFSGYSNIARGSAKLFGFELVRNFRHPYFAVGPRDFWRRWHISLSTWLRDYLYISLGGNRQGRLRTYANLMVTMLLGGLWHGASWNFVLWGAIHGVYLVVARALEPMTARLRPPEAGPIRWLALTAGGATTFVLVSFTWLFFRSTSVALTGVYLDRLALGTGFGDIHRLIPFAVLALLVLVIDLPQAIARDEHIFTRWGLGRRTAIAGFLLVAIFFGGAASAPFIYFQF
jgi:alginate O-acetyltransferase complex protein AlgI